MRIAICFNGQLRTAMHAAPAIKKWIGNLWDNCDFFVHTWDINTYKGPGKHFYESVKTLTNINLSSCKKNQFDVPLTVSEIIFIKDFYKPKFLIVDNYQKIRDYWSLYHQENYVKKFNLNEGGTYWESLYYSFYRSIELKYMYEKENNFEYDLVFKIRPDVSYPPGTSLQDEVELFNKDKSKFYIKFASHTENPSKIICLPDFYYCNSKNMNIASHHWLNNLIHNDLNIGQYCHNYNIGLLHPKAQQYGFHRLIATGVPSDDWELVTSLENLYNDPRFLDRNVKTNKILEEKLTKALLDYKVIDIFCNSFESTVL